ncbi:hypothetical protein J2X66_003202 [Pseudomonas sp. 3296]|nr:hypothetical protein [Pseudomonas sp. 3296]
MSSLTVSARYEATVAYESASNLPSSLRDLFIINRNEYCWLYMDTVIFIGIVLQVKCFRQGWSNEVSQS